VSQLLIFQVVPAILPIRRRRRPHWASFLPFSSSMHARELVELAGWVSAHGPALVEGPRQIPADGIERYWTGSKVRLDRWARSLKRAADAGHAARSETCGVLEEILTGEMLTRVWAAVARAYDRRRGTDDAEPVARSVLIGHVEARHRGLTLLAAGSCVPNADAIKLNNLRRRAERWTDVLVGRLAGGKSSRSPASIRHSRRAKDLHALRNKEDPMVHNRKDPIDGKSDPINRITLTGVLRN